MLKTGTTCFLESMFADRYGFDGLARAVEQSGIRGCLGKIVMDVGTYASDPNRAMHPGLVEDRTSLEATVQAHEKWNGAANDRIRLWFGARTPGGVSEALYKEMTAMAKKRQMGITCHVAEVIQDRAFFASQGHTPMPYCESVGMVGPHVLLVHMTQLDDSDIATLARTGTHVAHCPTSNTRIASGFCPVPALQKADVNIGLGTDDGPCNNICDMFREMHLAAIIHKPVHKDPTVVPAESVLEFATINGAKALGLQDSIGSLEVGKKADFVALDMNRCELQPFFSLVSAVVYSVTGRDVDVVVVDGRMLVEKGKLLSMDEKALVEEAMTRSQEIVQRAGLAEEVGSRWNVM